MKNVKMHGGLILSGLVGAMVLTGCLLSSNTPSDSSTNTALRSGNGASGNYGAGVAKVTICHIPPGNPANAHSITVGAPAVAAHLAHGDFIGACGDRPSTPPNKGGNDKDGKPNPGHKDDSTSTDGGKVPGTGTGTCNTSDPACY